MNEDKLELWKNVLDSCQSSVQGHVDIPNGVTAINQAAFRGCKELTSVFIPNSVTEIGVSVFAHCINLKEIIVSSDNEYFTSINGCLYNKDLTTLISYPSAQGKITIPNSVKEIFWGAFCGCTGLTDVVIPNSVKEIGWGAFCSSGLTNVVIPSSVKYIGLQAFSSCSSLTSVVIPNSIKIIDEQAFCDCTGLTDVVIPNSVNEIGNSAFANCTSLTNLVIPNSVKKIEYTAFENCTSLTDLVFTKSVNEIGWNAFGGCTGLARVTFPNRMDLTNFYDIFTGCKALKDVQIAPDNPRYATINGLLIDKTKSTLVVCFDVQKEMIIPDGVKVIHNNAFSGCTELNNVVIPDSVTKICGEAFKDCTGLTSIVIPENVTLIGHYAFSGCTNLQKVLCKSKVIKIGTKSFGKVAQPRCAFYVPKRSKDDFWKLNTKYYQLMFCQTEEDWQQAINQKAIPIKAPKKSKGKSLLSPENLYSPEELIAAKARRELTLSLNGAYNQEVYQRACAYRDFAKSKGCNEKEIQDYLISRANIRSKIWCDDFEFILNTFKAVLKYWDRLVNTICNRKVPGIVPADEKKFNIRILQVLAALDAANVLPCSTSYCSLEDFKKEVEEILRK